MKAIKVSGIFTFIAAIALFSFLSISCNDEKTKEDNTEESITEDINPENLLTIDLKVTGMNCEGCEKTIESSIYKLSGINHVKISYLDSSAVVEFDKTKTSEKEIKEAIRIAGYKTEE